MKPKLKRQWSAHEVVQTSNMDCGPAALASWMSSCGYSVSYPRLREACQTDVDGTSIDAMEELAERLGMPAEQVMVPVDTLFNNALRNLPCIAVVLLPNRLTHFVVVWRQCLGWVQIMDPAQGRVWLRKAELERRLFEHETLVAAQDWLVYAQGGEYRQVLQSMAEQLRLPATFVDDHFKALADRDDWRAWAALEGAMRGAMQLAGQGIKLTSMQCQGLVQTLVETPSQIPSHCWQVRPSDKSVEEIWLHGAVLLRCSEPEAVDESPGEPLAGPDLRAQAFASQMQATPQAQRNLMARLTAEVSHPLLFLLFGCALLVGVLTFVEALVFRTLISTSAPASFGAALQLMLVVLSPIAIGVGLLAICSSSARSLGRTLETRLRRRLLQHLPLISDSYFDSRLINDLAERGHALALLAKLPLLLQRLLVVAVRIVGVLLGLAWLLPAQALWVLLAGLAALGLPLFLYRTVRDLDLRVRTHSSAVGQIYLDALRGSEAIAAHGATQPMAFESEARVLRWHTAFRDSGWAVLSLETLQLLIMALVAVVLVQAALAQSATLGAVLLVAYWALFLPIMARQLLLLLREYPNLRNVATRVLEIVDAPTEVAQSAPEDELATDDQVRPQEEMQSAYPNPEPIEKQGVALQWRGVSVQRAEQPVLHELNLSIAASEQVAIVGRSGSGKSSFLSLLLGWLTPQAGQLLVDDLVANPERIALLREQTVVIDSQMYLWNRPLFDNLVFGSQGYSSDDLEIAVNDSALQEDLERYAQGLAQPLGENGSRLSGGEGQRVRVARGLLRAAPQLVLLDEPFVGMGSQQRRQLRQALRKRWPRSTLLFVVHDLHEVMDFSRVLVFGGGRILEDGEPKQLRMQADSAFAAMCAEESQLQQRLFTESGWRAIRVRPPLVSPTSAGSAAQS